MNPIPSVKTTGDLLTQYTQGERDFSGIVLNECTLSGAKLPHIILQQASLKVANLSTANLSHSNLRGATLNVSRLSGANLSQAQLQRAQLNVANLIRAVLVGADLSEASLIRAELLRADLSNATLSRANLQEADLREARLRWARLDRANLSQCNLRNGSLFGATLTGAQLHSATLENANLSGVILSQAELRHANLRSANLSSANLRSANLRWADLSGANLQDADLTDAKLSGANLTGASLVGATLEDTTLVHTDLSRTNLQQVYCVGSDLSGATLTGALMFKAICYDVQTKDTVCEWVDLSPHGDQSQTRRFPNAGAVQAYLNRRPPQVQLIIDIGLTPAAHASLAHIYDQIGQAVPTFNRPPNVEITHRRTILTFMTQAEAELSAIACLAAWPFADGLTIRTILSDLIAQGLERPHRSIMQDASHERLYAAITALDSQNLQPLKQTLEGHSFFAAPIQVKLCNISGQILELYHNARFGVRNLPSAEDGIFTVQPSQAISPDIEQYLTFLCPLEA
ncbi:MAG: pentapeptide repeat-containing protein [Cyanobacteria bacterium P01_H01_bin.58]